MTGRWAARESLMLAGAVLLSLSVAYCSGKKAGAVDARLEINAGQLKKQDAVIKSDSAKADTARRESDKLEAVHSRARTKVRVVKDSVFVRDTVYVDTDIAQVIVTADSTIAALKRSLALQDTLIIGLRKGIALRDERLRLYESRRNPRFSKGIQVGGGYCATQTGNSPCLYIGYGFQVRLP